MRDLGDDVTDRHTHTHTWTQPFIVKDKKRTEFGHLKVKGRDGRWMVLAHKILETAQSPNSPFPLWIWGLGFELGLGLRLVN